MAFQPKAAMAYRNKDFGEAFKPMLPGQDVFDSKGTETFGQIPGVKHEADTRFAGDALQNIGMLKGTRMLADAEVEAAEKIASAQKSAAKAQGNASMFGSIAKAGVGLLGMFMCDMRLKHNVAPLECETIERDALARADTRSQCGPARGRLPYNRCRRALALDYQS